MQPGNILAVGLNYASHAGTAGAAAPEMSPKLPNALAGANDPIWMFPDASNLHYEAELVVVIGKEGRNIPLSSAADYVFGVTAGNDVSERNWQARDLQSIRAKSSDSFAPIGPVIAAGSEREPVKYFRLFELLWGQPHAKRKVWGCVRCACSLN